MKPKQNERTSAVSENLIGRIDSKIKEKPTFLDLQVHRNISTEFFEIFATRLGNQEFAISQSLRQMSPEIVD